MIANTRLSVLAALLPIVYLSACSPTINSVSVTPGSDVNLVNVQANISNAPAASMGTPVLRVASLAVNPPVFHNVPGGFTQTNGPVHQKDGLVLPLGQFRIEVQQPYTPIFTSGTQTVSKTQDVTVSAPPGCFFFDGSLQGWTADGFFEMRSSGPTDLFGTRVPLCAGGPPPRIAANGSNFPQFPVSSPIPAAAFGSLATPLDPINNACFTQPTPTPQSGFVAVDLVSPDLSTATGWTNANGFELQAKGANPFGDPTHPLQIQLLLVDAAGTFFRPEDAQQHPTFFSLGPAFAPASFARPSTTLKQARVRVFVPVVSNIVPGVEVDIDRVCPKTAS